MSQLLLEGITKTFGGSNAVEDLTLTVDSGESVVLLGPSGCGKTTTLRMIAGFENPTSGTIHIGDRLVAGDGVSVPPENREVGVVFQSYALWPHMTVAENVSFGLTTRSRRAARKMNKADLSAAAGHALAQVQLDNLGPRYPHELSGGQQQRVALARALITQPSVLLLDEPLSNLDTRLREDMRFEIRRLQRESGITMVYITHDRTEALGLADRVVSLRSGRVQQVGPPEDLYQRPVSQFVAQSLGPANVLPGTVMDDDNRRVELVTGQQIYVRSSGSPTAAVAGQQVQVCVRPHDVSILAGTSNTNAVIENRSFLGDETHYLVAVDGVEETCRVFDRDLTNYDVGSRILFTVADGKANILGQERPSEVTTQYSTTAAA
jgi:ABC-type Fe3+/spermidine/putrescine transport system ATPase subunit